MRSIDSSFYHSPAWRKCRAAYLRKAGGLCERCLQSGRYKPAIEIHHITELNEENVKDASIAYGFDNLMALCHDCHNEVHNRRRVKRYEVLPDGTVVVK